MTNEVKKSYIREFKSHEAELMAIVDEFRCKTKHPIISQVYGHFLNLREFHYNYESGKGFIVCNEERVEL